MPELTVSMPAYNCAPFIQQSIESVLAQKGVDFEIVVVDDSSTDTTRDIVLALLDTRIRLISNPTRKGIAYCHNTVIKNSVSPYILHVDADDFVMPGAFKKMLATIKSSPTIGQAHCYFLSVNEKGRTTREEARRRRSDFLKNRPQKMDYKRALVETGAVMNTLRTYRRDVFDTVGLFNEKIRCGADLEMGIRIIDRFEIKLVPEFLYYARRHRHNTSSPHALVYWLQRALICAELLKDNKVAFLREKKYNVYKLLGRSLCETIGINALLKNVRRLKIKASTLLFQEIPSLFKIKLYEFLANCFQWWPLADSLPGGREVLNKEKRIAYFIRRYPVLSQTFIQREISGLLDSGVPVRVLAEASEDILDDEKSYACKNATRYLLPREAGFYEKYRKIFFRENRLRFYALFLYCLFHRYDLVKHCKNDKNVFSEAIYLAGVLREEKISHLHSPWANSYAFVALIASKLAGVTYSVEARAHDIHRNTFLYGFCEKFGNASFVITNSEFNRCYLASLLGKKIAKKICVIYEGIRLDEFDPGERDYRIAGSARILSVARLIEPKGLEYLLRACKILKDGGIKFSCKIVGGPEEPAYTADRVFLMQLHKELGLEHEVSFRGTIPSKEMALAYRTADLFVLPCVVGRDGTKDITPNALIEAMAMKLPAISTASTAIPEIVEDGVSGILVKPRDAAGLAAEIIRLTQDMPLRKKLGENARKRVAERFDMKKNAESFKRLFIAT